MQGRRRLALIALAQACRHRGFCAWFHRYHLDHGAGDWLAILMIERHVITRSCAWHIAGACRFASIPILLECASNTHEASVVRATALHAIGCLVSSKRIAGKYSEKKKSREKDASEDESYEAEERKEEWAQDLLQPEWLTRILLVTRGEKRGFCGACFVFSSRKQHSCPQKRMERGKMT